MFLWVQRSSRSAQLSNFCTSRNLRRSGLQQNCISPALSECQKSLRKMTCSVVADHLFSSASFSSAENDCSWESGNCEVMLATRPNFRDIIVKVGLDWEATGEWYAKSWLILILGSQGAEFNPRYPLLMIIPMPHLSNTIFSLNLSIVVSNNGIMLPWICLISSCPLPSGSSTQYYRSGF